ncbi:MAG: hypothetical protein LIP00_01255, partial [Parabacteroides sp.]|nr:hypothetical protein [Parabacteroides sp.]
FTRICVFIFRQNKAKRKIYRDVCFFLFLREKQSSLAARACADGAYRRSRKHPRHAITVNPGQKPPFTKSPISFKSSF